MLRNSGPRDRSTYRCRLRSVLPMGKMSSWTGLCAQIVQDFPHRIDGAVEGKKTNLRTCSPMTDNTSMSAVANERRRRASSRSPPVRLMREDREVRRPPFIETAAPFAPASPRSSASLDRRASPLRQCTTSSTGEDEYESLSGTNSNSNDTSDSSELDCTTTRSIGVAPHDEDEQTNSCAVL